MSLANKGDQIHPPKIPLDILDDSVRESFPDDLGTSKSKILPRADHICSLSFKSMKFEGKLNI